jgi:hypothetical protein
VRASVLKIGRKVYGEVRSLLDTIARRPPPTPTSPRRRFCSPRRARPQPRGASCRTAKALGDAEQRVGIIFERLRLDLHPERTRKVDLSNGKEGFDFLGCHHRKCVSRPLLLRTGKVRWYLQRWPSARSMKRVRQRVKELTGPKRDGRKRPSGHRRAARLAAAGGTITAPETRTGCFRASTGT